MSQKFCKCLQKGYIEPFTHFLGHLSRCLVVWGVLIFPSLLFTEVSFQKSSQATTTSRRSSATARTFRWTTWTRRRRRKRRRKRWNHPRRKRRSRKWKGWELPMWVDNEVSGMVRMWWCTYRVGYLFFSGERMFQVCTNVIFFFNWSWGNIWVLVLWWLKKSIETTRDRHTADWYSDKSRNPNICLMAINSQHSLDILKNNGGQRFPPEAIHTCSLKCIASLPVRFQAWFER